MGLLDSSESHGNDKEILEFQEEYPDIYAVVMEMLAGDYESEAVQQIKDDYPEVYDGILKMLNQEWNDKEVKDFKEEYPDIYSGVKKIAEREKGLTYTSEDGEEIAEVEQLQAEDARAKFYKDLKRQVPEWERINKDPEFIAWLGQDR